MAADAAGTLGLGGTGAVGQAGARFALREADAANRLFDTQTTGKGVFVFSPRGAVRWS